MQLAGNMFVIYREFVAIIPSILKEFQHFWCHVNAPRYHSAVSLLEEVPVHVGGYDVIINGQSSQLIKKIYMSKTEVKYCEKIIVSG